MAAWDDRLTWRDTNRAASEQRQADLLPACPRCADLLEVGARYCVECGCRVVHVPAVDDGDNQP